MLDPRSRFSLRPPDRARTARLAVCLPPLAVLGLAVLGALLTSLLLATSFTPAAAAAPCAPREVLLRRLAEGYGEAPQAMGLITSGALLELLVSPGGGSFSILMTRPPRAGQPGQVSCLVAAGEGWRSVAPAEAPAVQPGRDS